MNQFFWGVSALVFTSICSANPAATRWPQEVVTHLQSKNPYKAVCESGLSKQMKTFCDEFSALKKSKQKWPKANLKEGAIVLNDGQRTLQIKRTQDPTRFEINHRVIDIADHRQNGSLYKALVSLTPKVAEAQSLWINSAHAQWRAEDATSYDLMSVAAYQLVSSTSQVEICTAAHDFVKLCAVNIDTDKETPLFNHFLNKLSEGKVFSADDRRMFINSAEELRFQLYRMRSLTKGFDTKAEALLGCPSLQADKGRSAVDDVIECAQSLEEGMDDLAKVVSLVPANSPAAKKVETIQAEARTYTEKASDTKAQIKKSEGQR